MEVEWFKDESDGELIKVNKDLKSHVQTLYFASQLKCIN